MLKKIWFIFSLFLVLIIFLRMPQDTIGLSSFATKTNMLGSGDSSQKALNYITAITVFIYVALAFFFNLN